MTRCYIVEAFCVPMNACDIFLSAESNALLSLKLINLGKTLLTGEETKLYWFVTKPDTPNYACIPIKFFEMFIWYIRWTNPHSVAIRKQITNIRYHLITIHPISPPVKSVFVIHRYIRILSYAQCRYICSCLVIYT